MNRRGQEITNYIEEKRVIKVFQASLVNLGFLALRVYLVDTEGKRASQEKQENGESRARMETQDQRATRVRRASQAYRGQPAETERRVKKAIVGTQDLRGR